CFFFSSRRRHTILVSDWSSDVCSSDLLKPTVWFALLTCRDKCFPTPVGPFPGRSGNSKRDDVLAGYKPGPQLKRWRADWRQPRRSEERRVGKERRARGWA